MQRIEIPRIKADEAWRSAARALLASNINPGKIAFGGSSDCAPGLFDEPAIVAVGSKINVPRSFVSLANTVVWHSDPSRFDLLYSFLWRLRAAPQLMTDRGDRDLARLRKMEKSVLRCQHKMKAFVRFREIGRPESPRRSFAAWFEPTHHTTEPTARFFRDRFGDMDWRIVTPDISAIFENGKLRFVEDQENPNLPDDASEQLWVTYFQNIFNPARLKVQAMQSEMPKKYWKNLPEASAIPEMIANAPTRASAMVEAAPTLPPMRAAKAQALLPEQSSWSGSSDELFRAIRGCTRCPLHCNATQAVTGEGPQSAELMIVGEQPGDQEDLAGRPFIGPAGHLFDKAASSVGLDRSRTYVTNAVKHFKFVARGKRRIHQRQSAGEIEHCRWWLEAEIAKVQPRLIVAMGATAAQALTGTGERLLARCGKVERTFSGHDVLITTHPSYLLRLREAKSKELHYNRFCEDLRSALSIVAGQQRTAEVRNQGSRR